MTGVLVFLLVLSFLVFFHELGHFLAAKTFGIYVDRFSIGMPPRVIGFKWGETDYCIGALPIGGFVKMAGQEDAPLTEEEREKEYGSIPPERWFNNKPVWQRMIVLLAGPVANLILAVVLYGVLVGVGEQVPESMLSPRVGNVMADYPAASAKLYAMASPDDTPDMSGEPDAIGWQPGDLILSMNGAPLANIIPELAVNALLHGDEKAHDFVIERTNADDTKTYYRCAVKPERKGEERYPRFGVDPFSAVFIADILPETPAEAAGLQPDDIILRANGAAVDTTTFLELTQDMPEGQSLDLLVERGGEKLHLALTPKTVGRLKGASFGVPKEEENPESAVPVVAYVDEEFKTSTGLQRKDKITAVNGQPTTLKAFQDLMMASPGQTLSVSVDRPAILFGLLQRQKDLTLDLPVDSVRAIGISMGPKTVFHRVPLSGIFSAALNKSYTAVTQTVLTLKALALQDVSPKDLGGPVMIFQVTSNAASMGWGRLLDITALISINLFVFNLLPLPVLDGGQILINAVEWVRRKPVSMVVLERYQTIGLVLIIGLMLFVTWNDVGRLITDALP
jgi:regulator of sigma E protease